MSVISVSDIARLKALIAKKKGLLPTNNNSSNNSEPISTGAAEIPVDSQPVTPINGAAHIKLPYESTDKYGKRISLNEKQSQAVDLAVSGASFVLVGAAGTGKTTATREMISAMVSSFKLGTLLGTKHKTLKDNTPGVVCVSYTRRAVSNLKRAMSTDLQDNCLTIHKLLEYEPVYDTIFDPNTGLERKSMSFLPARNSINPLSPTIKTIIFDESSMVSLELFHEILAACPHNPQFIFLGDIQQLPPVFGSAILGFKMLELPAIELTEVYRQALESPIIRLAHRILSGKPIAPDEFPEWKLPGLTIHPWKKKLHPDIAVIQFGKFITQAITQDLYNPDEDIILCPFIKSFGTTEINAIVANHIARSKSVLTYEIIAGFNKYYFSPGDKVLVDKEDGIVLEITENAEYSGARFQPASPTLDYWGCEQGDGTKPQHHVEELSEWDVDDLLEAASSTDDEDRVRQCSHKIKVRLIDSDRTIELKTASDVNKLSLGFAMSVHKSQGSEWRKVFFILHESHATMMQRELMYTACTRAKEELYVICPPEAFVKGITGQRIKGNTLAEKSEFFRGKVNAGYLKQFENDILIPKELV